MIILAAILDFFPITNAIDKFPHLLIYSSYTLKELILFT